MPYTRCADSADACVEIGYAVGHFARPNAGTPTSSAPAHIAAPNGSPHAIEARGAAAEIAP